VIVWDLDGTLGDFEAAYRDPFATTAVTVRVRPGIDGVLARLSATGVTHTVLTLATAPAAELVLRGTGLRRHFARVEGRGVRGKGDVAGLAWGLGVAASEVGDRFLFVGDNPRLDVPQDAQVVFHFEPHGATRPGADVEALVRTLLEEGEGSFGRGFERLRLAGAQAGLVEAGGPAVRCALGDAGTLLLASGAGVCPICAFEVPSPKASIEAVSFVPAEVRVPEEEL